MTKIRFTLLSTWLLGLLLMSANQANGQAVVTIEKNQHDFGAIKEDGGKVKHTFTLKNTGNKDLLIMEVKSPCGCTVPKWPKEPLKPGEEAKIDATFDPMFRPGIFNKVLTVKTNAEPKNAFITIMGEVLPREKTIVDAFPSRNGNLRFQLPHIFFGKISSNKSDTLHVKMYNAGNQTINISTIACPEHITYTLVNQSIAPGKIGKFILNYNPIKKRDYGILSDKIVVVTDDELSREKMLNVTAEIEPYKPALTPKELEKAPKISVEKPELDLGTISSKKKVKGEFIIKNVGFHSLNIISVKPECGCTTTNPSNISMEKDQTSTISLEFDPAGMTGLVIKEITVYTTDPVSPKTTLRIRAVVI